MKVMDKQILHKIVGTRATIGATEGKETLASAVDVFNYIDPNFQNWGCDKAEQPTEEMDVEVYEQIEDADYQTIFSSFNKDLDILSLTTAQIKSFVLHNAKDYMREAEEWTTFRFLFKVENEFCIADTRVHSDGTRDVRVRRLSYDGICYAEHRHRIVIPQQV
jgi:hypothetical protein